jgi:hypothetical protein
MFALFYELPDAAMQFITTCDDREEARILGKMFSRYRELPVVAVINPPSGETISCFRFEHGKVFSLTNPTRPGLAVIASRAANTARAAHAAPRAAFRH